MKKSHTLVLPVVLVAALTLTGTAFAQDGTDPPPEPVTGEVTEVNVEEGWFIYTPDGGITFITVYVDNNEYDHPIVELLDAYFGYDLQAWADALAAGETVELSGNATSTETPVLDPITGEPVLDPITGEPVMTTTWTMVNAGDEIAAYHDDGMGFGVLTKLYAMSQTSGTSVEELLGLFKGTGEEKMSMGQLFKEYGKPDKLGPGHVRQELGLAGNDKDKPEKSNKSGDKKPKKPKKSK